MSDRHEGARSEPANDAGVERAASRRAVSADEAAAEERRRMVAYERARGRLT